MNVRRTKIVATLGPATSSPEAIAALIGAGVNVARINASHGTAKDRGELVQRVRAAAREADRPVAVLLDLQGPRIRVGTLPRPVTLTPGAAVVFAPERVAEPGEIPTTYEALATDVHVGGRILLDDGNLACEVTAVRPPRVEALVIYGGELKSNKGMNLPGVQVSAPSLTEKDLVDVKFAVKHEVDFVALSFVRRAEDIVALRALLDPGIRVIAKIEKDTALQDAENIIDASDGIMVARGDLGVELPFEEVPAVQKRLIRLAIQHRRPVITATQMLESMIEHPRPTRAEASDVANAILDGTDAVMLSAETAAGKYPREAVEAMDRIIRQMEGQDARPRRDERLADRGEPAKTEVAVAAAAVAAARMLHAPLIIAFTKSGFTVRIIAANRPPMPILGVTEVARTYRQLALLWGVIPVYADQPPRYEAMLDAARERILAAGYATSGDCVVTMAGIPFNVPSNTNSIKIEVV